MTINKYATAAGKKFESDLVKYLRECGFDAERLHLAGAEDEGDIVLRREGSPWPLMIIEAKRTKSLDLGGWVKQANDERDHFAYHRGHYPENVPFVVVHYARGKGIGSSYVTTTLDEWLARL